MTVKVWAFFLGFTVLAGVVAWQISPAPNAGFANAAAVITFATVIAVGIERLMELWWTLLGQVKGFGGWWPLNLIAESVQTVETQTNNLLTPVFEDVSQALQEAKNTLKAGSDEMKKVSDKLTEIQKARANFTARLAAAQQLAPGSPRFAMTTQVAADAASVLGEAAALGGDAAVAVREAVDNAANAASIATTIVASFGDNPARRIASILLGAGAGMLAAGFMGLNLFSAVLGQSAGPVAGVVGVLLTGIVMGLGSGPTHEVIKSFQDYKESRKQPDTAALVPTSSPTSGDVLFGGGDTLRLLEGRDLIAPYESRTSVRRLGGRLGSVPIRSTN
jgi:hypothetical protein